MAMNSDAEGGNGFGGPADQYGFMSYSSSQSQLQQPAAWGPSGNGADADDDFSNEPPLMQELGFDFTHIAAKVLGVLHPLKTLDDNIMADTDMAGPIAFALILGVCMLFVRLLMLFTFRSTFPFTYVGASILQSGKVNFGYIYGFGAMGTSA